MIVIMPEGENSFYVNAYTEPKDRFEDYLINDLPNYIQQNYPIDRDNQAIDRHVQNHPRRILDGRLRRDYLGVETSRAFSIYDKHQRVD